MISLTIIILQSSFINLLPTKSDIPDLCYCTGCFAKDACYLIEQKGAFTKSLPKLFKEKQHGIRLKKNNRNDNGNCASYRIALITSHLLEFEEPGGNQDCRNDTCTQCYQNLKNVKFWNQLSSSICEQEFETQVNSFEKLLNVFKEILLNGNDYQIRKCSGRCPLNYVFCIKRKKCIQNLEVKKKKKGIYVLPQMYSNMSFSPTWILNVLSHKPIILINHFDIYDGNGSWQYNNANQWQNLSSIPQNFGVKLDSHTLMRYTLYSPQYGLRLLYYTVDNSKWKVGNIVPSTDFKAIKIAAIFIHPSIFNSSFSLLSNSKVYQIKKDDYWNEGFQLNELFKLYSPLKVIPNPIADEYIKIIPYYHLNLFYQSLEAFELFRPFGRIIESIQNLGRLEVEVQTKHGLLSFDSQQINYFLLDYNNSKVVFRPRKNFYGTLNISIEFYSCFFCEIKKPIKSVNIVIIVNPVNDSPINSSNTLYLPPIGFNLTDEPNYGFTIAQLVALSKGYDVERGNKIGIAVFKVPECKFGKWQHLKNRRWENIIVNNDLDILNVNLSKVSLDTVLNLFYLDNHEQIRFNLNGDYLWNVDSAYYLSFLGFSFWDMQDNVSIGVQNISLREILLSNSYLTPKLAILLRRGCDNVEGSMKRYDKCGICGGNGFGCSHAINFEINSGYGFNKIKEQATVTDITEYKESFIKFVLELATQVGEGEKVISHSISKVTSNGICFSDSSKYQIVSKLCMLIRQEINKVAFNKFRRRRSATVNTNGTDSLEKIRYVLQSFANGISSNNLTNSALKLKKNFTDITNNLVFSMCKSTDYGQPAISAKSKLVELQALKLNFNETSKIDCINCTEPIYAIWEYVNMMSQNWNCGSVVCSGLCIGYTQFTSDLYSNDTGQDLATNIVSFVLINTSNYTSISTEFLSTPVEISLPLTSDLCQDCIYDCITFDISLSNWSNVYCSSSQQIKVSNGIFYILCNCNKLGIHSAVLRKKFRSEPSCFANVQIKFLNDYAATLTRVSKASLESSLKMSIVAVMQIEFWRIRNMSCSNGSIISSFQFLPSDVYENSDPVLTFNDDLQRLSNHVSNGDLLVTLNDGFQLTVDTTYFSYSVSVVTSDNSDEEHHHSELGVIIAGGVVGGLGFFIVIVYLFKKFKVLSLLRTI
ncbi:uncharacterized protein LOC100202590 isoform X4 [Hydra vulgaris]|uniref:Uncharacterized protein LOC100202590 isoform X4 n=2 Tax=Hydra vulgaris TaxID=6087 RepID=A0ABM4BJT5_HYDVU